MALVAPHSIFIHIQKTGGMTVRRAMHRCKGEVFESGAIEVERHFGLPELLTAHPGIDAGRYVFGFVRHPVSWLHSRWAFGRVSGYTTQMKHRPSAASLWMASCWHDTFDGFIDRYLERFPGIATQEMFRRLGLWSDRPADFVGRMETLMPDLVRALYEAGEEFDEAALVATASANRSIPPESFQGKKIERVLMAERALVDRFY